MDQIWQRLLCFWKNIDAVSIENVNPPARDVQLSYLQDLIGNKLPHDFLEFYRIHNGWKRDLIMPGASMLLSIEEICEELPGVSAFIPDGYTTMIPFTRSSRGRDFHCLAMDGNAGTTTLFISTDMQECEIGVNSFRQWMEDYLIRLENRRDLLT